MSDKKYSQRNIRKITKNGSSHSVSIPVELLNKLGWKERQKVTMKLQRRKIIISDWKPKRGKK